MKTERNIDQLKNYLTDSEKMELNVIMDRARERAELLAVNGMNYAGSVVVRSYMKKDEKRLDDLIMLARARHMALAMRKREREVERKKKRFEMGELLKTRLREEIALGNVDRNVINEVIREARSAREN